MSANNLMTIVLAAGKGTRMRSDTPKILHAVAGRSMLGHVLAATSDVAASATVVVVGPDMDHVAGEARKHVADVAIAVQGEQRGTADAVLAAREMLTQHDGDVLVLFADTPLILPQTLSRLQATLAAGASIAVLGFEARNPTGYGRLICDGDGQLVAIREEKDASPDERRITLCNSGVMGFRCPNLLQLLTAIGNNNAKGEYYLTDAIAIARQQGLTAAVTVCDEDEVLGVNSRDQLAVVERLYQERARQAAMQAGCTMIAPETVWLSFDTVIGQDVTIEPNVFFEPGVTLESNVHIRANCHLSGVHVHSGAIVGPFARLRPGAVIGPDVHIGNFVEVKNVDMGAGAKANHLAYLGDGMVGEGANIGAGTIFCNYDGFSKHRTEVGAQAFIGSNSALVAPVKIGDGAFVGSGSVISRDVNPDALALERNEQVERPGWAAKFRRMMSRKRS